jgi:hypothetical protein
MGFSVAFLNGNASVKTQSGPLLVGMLLIALPFLSIRGERKFASIRKAWSRTETRRLRISSCAEEWGWIWQEFLDWNKRHGCTILS